MPYKITAKGIHFLSDLNKYVRPKTQAKVSGLTDWQMEVLKYLETRKDDGYVASHDIGYDLKEHPRAISGIAYSLIKKGLVEKKE